MVWRMRGARMSPPPYLDATARVWERGIVRHIHCSMVEDGVEDGLKMGLMVGLKAFERGERHE
jgi:hypothetical protein